MLVRLSTRGHKAFLSVTVSQSSRTRVTFTNLYMGPTRRAVNLERVRVKVADTRWILSN